MADVKISGLTAVSAVEANDLLEVSEDTGGGTYASRKATATQIKAFASADSVQKSGDTMTGSLMVNVSSASDALRITQTGTGNALVVEDSANPDATPFVIDALGNVGIGTSSPGVKFAIASTDAIQVPVGTTGERPAGATGYMRYNTTLNSFEGYNGTAWGSIGGGAAGGSSDKIFYLNDQIVTANYSIPSGQNAGTFGPISINSGVTVTVPSGSTWTVV